MGPDGTRGQGCESGGHRCISGPLGPHPVSLLAAAWVHMAPRGHGGSRGQRGWPTVLLRQAPPEGPHVWLRRDSAHPWDDKDPRLPPGSISGREFLNQTSPNLLFRKLSPKSTTKPGVVAFRGLQGRLSVNAHDLIFILGVLLRSEKNARSQGTNERHQTRSLTIRKCYA